MASETPDEGINKNDVKPEDDRTTHHATPPPPRLAAHGLCPVERRTRDAGQCQALENAAAQAAQAAGTLRLVVLQVKRGGSEAAAQAQPTSEGGPTASNS
jgi:hypothetical protein